MIICVILLNAWYLSGSGDGGDQLFRHVSKKVVTWLKGDILILRLTRPFLGGIGAFASFWVLFGGLILFGSKAGVIVFGKEDKMVWLLWLILNSMTSLLKDHNRRMVICSYYDANGSLERNMKGINEVFEVFLLVNDRGELVEKSGSIVSFANLWWLNRGFLRLHKNPCHPPNCSIFPVSARKDIFPMFGSGIEYSYFRLRP